MSILDLKGHSFDMVGFKTADGTAYIADSVSSSDTLDKYGLQMSAQQYVLIGSTLRSYLSNMYTENVLTYHFTDNQMVWERV